MTRLNRDWVVQPHGPVETVDEGLATVAGEIVMPLGRFPRRMTVVALGGGRSLVWSAIPLAERAMHDLEAMGRPSVLAIPGIAHRLDAAAWKARYPAIKVLCPPGAYDAVKEAVPIDHTADPFGDPSIRFEIAPGVGELEGVLVVRRKEAVTLVINDLLANVRRPRGLGAKIMARLFGFGVRRPEMPRIVRRRFVRDAAALAAAFRRWSELPGLARVIVSHGEIIADRPREVLARMADELAG
jgi:hypothetical protein